jgi:hypothetical protein
VNIFTTGMFVCTKILLYDNGVAPYGTSMYEYVHSRVDSSLASVVLLCVKLSSLKCIMAGFTVLGFPVELCRLWYIEHDVISLHEVLASSSSHTS